MIPYISIIVDMQPQFDAANKLSVQKACVREIKKNIRDKAPIIFLEYHWEGSTADRLVKATEDYNNVWFLTKKQDDGSNEIKKWLAKQKYQSNKFRVCGVNSDYCVLATVGGLKNKYPKSKIQVICDACWAYEDHRRGLELLKKTHKAEMVRAPKWLK